MSDPLVFPDQLTDPLRRVLGIANFRCGPIARKLRLRGWTIQEKAEQEQAVVLHWLVTLALRHGENWADEAEGYLNGPPDVPGPH